MTAEMNENGELLTAVFVSNLCHAWYLMEEWVILQFGVLGNPDQLLWNLPASPKSMVRSYKHIHYSSSKIMVY